MKVYAVITRTEGYADDFFRSVHATLEGATAELEREGYVKDDWPSDCESVATFQCEWTQNGYPTYYEGRIVEVELGD